MFKLIGTVRRVLRPQILPTSRYRQHARTLTVSSPTWAKKGHEDMPEFWVRKMKTMFSAFDIDGDGYVGEGDFESWYQRTLKVIPDMPKTRAEKLRAELYRIWVDYFNEGESPMPGHKVSEEKYVQAMSRALQNPRLRDAVDQPHRYFFDAVDVNQDGQITLEEHILCCEALGLGKEAAIASFCAIDRNVDGVITREEVTSAARDFFTNTSDETNPSKHFMGPLKE